MSNTQTRNRILRIATLGGVGLTVVASGLAIRAVRSLDEAFTSAISDPYLATEES
jgi:hypothetical protein